MGWLLDGFWYVMAALATGIVVLVVAAKVLTAGPVMRAILWLDRKSRIRRARIKPPWRRKLRRWQRIVVTVPFWVYPISLVIAAPGESELWMAGVDGAVAYWAASILWGFMWSSGRGLSARTAAALRKRRKDRWRGYW